MFDKKEFSAIYRIVETGIKQLEERLLTTIDQKIESFRRSVYVREVWCCNEMRSFASDIWNAPKPKTDSIGMGFGSVAYQLKGRNVNYCPFCGAYFGSKK